ncbi:hypothetical protein P691DRAFT_356318 [Macrolepiota fuliginosa MF-IS2]|uniref:Peptidase C14 caspase domain-containing protein n=1 Tax=Macrolepiota fuliginosa MF-IS2 TaxID=1400762 RepID=A0A9P5X3N5_9AGAR|nr:hypothetical protein P691DRAFT_356318 [Macrolepiota fuliginosa MF-IS2]
MGIRKALLVGANYTNTAAKLDRPQHDITDFRSFLIQRYGFREEDITVLSDDPAVPPSQQPTYDNIMEHLENFVDRNAEGAQYLFVFCGHAMQKPAINDLEEEDGLDEYIIPVDAMNAEGAIEDDSKLIIQDNTLRKYLVDAITATPSSQMVAIWDACHSNTIMDLHHHRCNRVDGAIHSRFRRLGREALEIGSKIFGDCFVDKIAHLMYELEKTWKDSIDPSHAKSNQRVRVCTGYCRRGKITEMWGNQGRVVCISACKDPQQSWEHPKKGSLTPWLMEVLSDKPNPSLKELMHSLGEQTERYYQSRISGNDPEINKKMKQSPQLSTEIPAVSYMDELLFLDMPRRDTGGEAVRPGSRLVYIFIPLVAFSAAFFLGFRK